MIDFDILSLVGLLRAVSGIGRHDKSISLAVKADLETIHMNPLPVYLHEPLRVSKPTPEGFSCGISGISVMSAREPC